jgi:transcriptional regulator with XRE-family HTH domain
MESNEDALRRFGARLSMLRQQKKMTIRDLSLASGLEPGQIERIEEGKVNFLFTTILALAKGLDTDPGELLETL